MELRDHGGDPALLSMTILVGTPGIYKAGVREAAPSWSTAPSIA
jgi:hypothetical protein